MLQIEVDATSIRTFRFGASSQSFAPEIRKWQAKHKNARKPTHFICHLRVAGAIERGPAGRVLLDVLPLVALTPGARPPTESSHDVNQTRFFEKIQRGRGTRIHADGNRAWKAEAKKAGFQFSSVSHSRMQFVKKVPRKKLFTGTQLLDSFWKILKQFVVSNLRTRGKFDRRVDRRLLDQIKAFMYRHNAGHNLWKEQSWPKKSTLMTLQGKLKKKCCSMPGAQMLLIFSNKTKKQ